MPPRPLRLPFYRNAGGAGGETGAAGGDLAASQSSRASREIRGERPTGQLRGAPHRGPRAKSSSPRPGHTAPRAPASSARWPTTAPPARRPSPPGRGDRQRAAPASRLQVHGREPRAGSTWPCCRSRSSPVAARWSIATKGRAGGGPAPRSAGHPPCLPPPTLLRLLLPSRLPHARCARQPREDDRRAARSRFPVGEAPLKNYLAGLRGAQSPPRVGLGLAAAAHARQRGPRRRVPSPRTPFMGRVGGRFMGTALRQQRVTSRYTLHVALGWIWDLEVPAARG